MNELKNKLDGEILVIIDPQNDFMDTPKKPGSLAVKGAYEDMNRLSTRIDNNPPNAIVVTLDSHAMMHIAHPLWFVDSNGKNPDFFTLITVEDLEKGVWKAANSEVQEYTVSYAKKLKEQGKYELRIWPFHCIVGKEGHNVEANLQSSLTRWEEKTGNKVMYVRKGANPKTEHYSIFKAEVPVENDPDTQLNIKLIEEIRSYKKNTWAGEASSHCLGGSLLDYLDNIPQKDREKSYLLEDCTSPVGGYEEAHIELIDKLKQLNVNIVKSIEAKKLKI
jgi:nicotinamidase/pyrazinamidase